MVKLDNIERSRLMEILQQYPWFAPARAMLCLDLCAEAGFEDAKGLLRESLPYLPDSAYIYKIMHSMEERIYADEALKNINVNAPAPKPRIIMAGMDFFSREDYEREKKEEDASISNMAMVDYSLPAPDFSGNQSRSEDFGIVSETLAEIYANQGYPERAKQIYMQLSLQNPEKSAYFATLIDNLK